MPVDPYAALADAAAPGVWLDGAWGLVGARPAASFCYHEGVAWRRGGHGAWREAARGDAWEALRAFAREGGHCVGIVTYDAGRLIERIPARALDDTRLPALLFHRFASLDAARPGPAAGGRSRRGRGRGPQDASSGPEPGPGPASYAPIKARTTQKEFEAMVVRAQEDVRAGEVFQVNLSHRLETRTALSPLALYARLREANPAPFAACFASGTLPAGLAPFHVLSSSPERLFELRADGTLDARPIAGTRPRSADPAEDARLQAELLADPKERAEHVMLVDLARNDLGRVARFGSVRVPHLLTVESYRTVHHLVSRVEADLAPGKDAIDALVALFPGGTITGAPKVRAMEIIEEIEPVRRGVYTGSLVWLRPDGSCDANILIRTLLVRDGAVHLQAGAGIVEESVPAREYAETLAKAEGLLRALRRPG